MVNFRWYFDGYLDAAILFVERFRVNHLGASPRGIGWKIILNSRQASEHLPNGSQV